MRASCFTFFLGEPTARRIQGGKDAASARYIFTRLTAAARKQLQEIDDTAVGGPGGDE